jgi:hypothetical protein
LHASVRPAHREFDRRFIACNCAQARREELALLWLEAFALVDPVHFTQLAPSEDKRARGRNLPAAGRPALLEVGDLSLHSRGREIVPVK